MPPPPHHGQLQRRLEEGSSASKLLSIIIPSVLLPPCLLLACWPKIRRLIAQPRRRTAREDNWDLLSSANGSELGIGEEDTPIPGPIMMETQPEQIVDIHEMTREGHTLTVVVLPAEPLREKMPFPEPEPAQVTQSGEGTLRRSEEEPEPEFESQPATRYNSVASDAAALGSGTSIECCEYSRHFTREYEYSYSRFLEEELRRIQGQMVDVDELTTGSSTSISRQSLASILGSTAQPGADSGEFNLAELLRLARDKNTALTARIETLERQMESSWALGLSDEPPPGYSIST
ncbi:hypothetical protein FB45DRAFT_1035897 [Roridomyces roridus]|uniref:Uncharacterized protein n=1 Tax=Roridomyces roridus TaxID=1738132 RepID=A0AAD7B9C5_9AGAR|nr:hypothetical protein FB45DRAFT_1035897 [Roridomyces roridus]